MLREEFVERCAEELAVDQEFQGDGSLGFQESVDQCGELVAFDICRSIMLECMDIYIYIFLFLVMDFASPVDTRMGPVSCGNSISRSSSLDLRWIRTCVEWWGVVAGSAMIHDV